MVLLLNLIPWIIFLSGAVLSWKVKSDKWKWVALIGTVGAMALYYKAQPSYLPKGDIQRTEVPSFEQSKAEIQDNNRKPVPSEIRNAEQERKYKEGLVFVK